MFQNSEIVSALHSLVTARELTASSRCLLADWRPTVDRAIAENRCLYCSLALLSGALNGASNAAEHLKNVSALTRFRQGAVEARILTEYANVFILK